MKRLCEWGTDIFPTEKGFLRIESFLEESSSSTNWMRCYRFGCSLISSEYEHNLHQTYPLSWFFQSFTASQRLRLGDSVHYTINTSLPGEEVSGAQRLHVITLLPAVDEQCCCLSSGNKQVWACTWMTWFVPVCFASPNRGSISVLSLSVILCSKFYFPRQIVERC